MFAGRVVRRGISRRFVNGEQAPVHHQHLQSTIHDQKESEALLTRQLEGLSAALRSALYLEPDQSRRCSKPRYLELASKLIRQVSAWLLPNNGLNSCRKLGISTRHEAFLIATAKRGAHRRGQPL